MARLPARAPRPEDAAREARGLISLFVRHPNAANLLMVLMIIFGAFALGRIDTQFFPTVERPVINVTTAWPGASASDVSDGVLEVVEPAVRFADGMEQMVSYAREGSGTVTLTFADGTDVPAAVRQIETAVATLALPEDAERPEVSRSVWYDSVATLAVAGEAPERILRDWAKRLRDELIDGGIDRVEFTGLRSPEIVVRIPERELRRLGLSIAEVSRAVASNARDRPSGSVDGAVERQLRALADIEGRGQLARVEIVSLPSGEKITLGDIGAVRPGFDEGAVRGFSGGTPAIEMEVKRSGGTDTLEAAAILDEVLAEFEPQLPDNVRLLKYDIRSDALSERIWLLVENGILGLVLVVVTLFVFLNARIAFWVAAGIPVAMLATIGLMWMLGQSINMISLFALIMMLGIIVDDAIVVGEHTDTRLSLGDDPYTAAENGAGQMVTPVAAAMTTTVASFAPMFVLGDTIGQIMGVLPIVAIAVIIASMVECFLILPGHLGHSVAKARAGRRGAWSFARQMTVALVLGALALGLLTRGDGAAGMPTLVREGVEAANDFSDTYGAAALALALACGTLVAGAFVEAIVSTTGQGRSSALRMLGVVLLGAPLVWFGLTYWNATGPWFRDLPIMAEWTIAAGTALLFEVLVLRNGHKLRGWFDAGFAWFRDRPFGALVRASYRFRYVTLAVAVGTMFATYGLNSGGHVGFAFFPSPESERINARVTFNAGIPEEEATAALALYENALEEAVEGLRASPDERVVKAVFTTLGQSGRSRGDNVARIQVQLTTSEERSVRTPDITNAWKEAAPELPGVQRFSISESRGGPPGRDVDVIVQGRDLDSLKLATAEIIPLLEEIDGVSGVADDLPYGKPELAMRLTPRGSALGFTIEEVGRQVRDAFEGAVPRRFARGDEEVTVRIEREARNPGSAALREFELLTPSGGFVPLLEVVDLSERQGFSAIQRRDGRSTVSITADIDPAVNTTDGVLDELRATGRLDTIASAYDVTYRFDGRAREQRRAFSELGIGASIALSVIYIVLAWVFGSYWRPFAVMLIIPFGVVGAVWGHWLLGFKLTILSFVGLLGLAGILVNDSIILVSRLDERLASGDTLEEAATGASRDRLRAVLLTSLTTIGGLLPLMYETSLQAQFLLPMAITMVFGLGLATVLVLFLVPALVGIGGDIRAAFSWTFGEGTGRVGAWRRSPRGA